jgi:hypothetical protein
VNTRRRRAPSGASPQRRAAATAEFWGRQPADEEPAPERIRASDDPTAMVRSLGAPPLPGRERVAEYYFAAVYEKSATLAVALAAASNLLDEDEE